MTPEWKEKKWRPMPKYVETTSECVKPVTAAARQRVVVKDGDQVKPVAAGAAVPEKAQPVEQRELDGHLERCAQQKKSTIGELCGVSIIDGLKHVCGVLTEHELLSSTCQLRGSRLRRRFKLNAEATSFNPWNPWLAEGDAGSKREQSLVANDDLWEHFRKIYIEEREITATLNYCSWLPDWKPTVKKDLNVWKQDMVRDSSLRKDQWKAEVTVKRWQQSLEEELQADTPVYAQEIRKIYKVGWRPVWAVDSPDDSAFPPLGRTGPLLSKSHGTALKWNALNWGGKLVEKIQEENIGEESKTATRWKLGWIKSERSLVRMSKSETDIRPQLVDMLDICVDLDALSKHASLYVRRGIVYLVTEKRKRLKKANKWKVKLQKKRGDQSLVEVS